MESGILKYAEGIDCYPVISEIIALWDRSYKASKVFTKNGKFWVKVKGPKLQSADKSHPLLGWLWREKPGLYCVFTDAKNWPLFDPANVRVDLADYVESFSDWSTYRFEGSYKSEPIDKRILIFKTPPPMVTPEQPLILGDLIVTKIWPSVRTEIGHDCTRVDEASIKPSSLLNVVAR